MRAEICVRVFAHDRELRSWLVDELALLSSLLEVRTVDALDAAPMDLLIVDVDGLAGGELDRLRELAATTRVIAIGASTAALHATNFAAVLDARLTSKQLKRAVRDALAAPPPTQPA